MKTIRICLLLAVAGVLATAHTAWGDGWSLSKLNPFASKSKSTQRSSNQPTALQQLGNGTKKVVGTTADIVTLKWLASKETPPEPKYRWAHKSRRAEPQKKSFFDFLLPAKEPPQPQTPGEWMAQERPAF